MQMRFSGKDEELNKLVKESNAALHHTREVFIGRVLISYE